MSLLDFVQRSCPYCGEWLEISIDPSVETQSYVEDCQVCCSPFVVHVELAYGEPDVRLVREDGVE
ncbi:MAG: CPXCG motif-containing cysteine-rich protein [Chromatiales bacterium]|jgi:hypothetical protein|nr:CPXCG motif-containing cysteine-rich protein [Chromatiales bacterium]